MREQRCRWHEDIRKAEMERQRKVADIRTAQLGCVLQAIDEESFSQANEDLLMQLAKKLSTRQRPAPAAEPATEPAAEPAAEPPAELAAKASADKSSPRGSEASWQKVGET